jgi:hypothetical protein
MAGGDDRLLVRAMMPRRCERIESTDDWQQPELHVQSVGRQALFSHDSGAFGFESEREGVR